MTAGLAEQQRALLQALGQPRHQDAMNTIAGHAHSITPAATKSMERGLRAYRSNSRELAPRVLAAAYPVVAELLGAENFEALARQCWRCHPPEHGDLAQWGAALAGVIGGVPDLAGPEPYLADVARVEWALHRAATAADRPADPSSFGLLGERDPALVTLVLAPGTTCIDSPHPVASIANAHIEGDPTLEEAGRRLRDRVPECALVWRQALRPKLRLAQPGEAAFIGALQAGQALPDALAAAPELDFNGWLVPAVRSGLALGVRTR